MAKELPYFKFFVSEWNDGDITLEDYDVQGLFINLCSYYWSNECNLLFRKAEKKFKDAPKDLWETLLESEIIKIKDDKLVISFLDEQQDERLVSSKIKSKAGKASAEARRLKKLQQELNINSTENQHVLNPCSTESQLLREEKRREEKNYTKKDFLCDWNELRKEHLKKPSFLNTFSSDAEVDFNKLTKDYKREDFRDALIGLFKQKKLPNGMTTMQSNPKHFLKTFESYLTAYHDKNVELYGKPEEI